MWRMMAVGGGERRIVAGKGGDGDKDKKHDIAKELSLTGDNHVRRGKGGGRSAGVPPHPGKKRRKVERSVKPRFFAQKNVEKA